MNRREPGPLKRIKSFFRGMGRLDLQLRAIQEGLGRIEARQNETMAKTGLATQEFKVYSQWGEDGIIQCLLRHVEVARTVFVEFGVEDYLESNTRFLLTNNNWSGLVIDGSGDNVARIRADPIYWRHNLKAECEFINKDNINELLGRNGISGDIGLLSIDIDGNDYWIWKEINVIRPRIVIVEYNARFGWERAVTVPYDAAFNRRKAHSSMVYFGASLRALVDLGKNKGYSFVGCGSHGINAFFVRSELMGPSLRELTVKEGFVAAKVREARNADGELMFLDPEQEREILRSLPLVDVAG